MNMQGRTVDAVVIGGGFYGVVIAVYLAKQRGVKRVLLIEQETALLTRASYNNQARIHNGYHYPRSFTTAYRSRVNLPKFIKDWPGAVKTDFDKLYAIARKNSKVTARQLEVVPILWTGRRRFLSGFRRCWFKPPRPPSVDQYTPHRG